jgi:hypothetical protein
MKKAAILGLAVVCGAFLTNTVYSVYVSETTPKVAETVPIIPESIRNSQL